VLVAKKRERIGSRYSRRIREQGGLPAVVYGHKQEPVAVVLNAKEAITHIMKGEKVYRLEMEGGESETVLLRDLQYDYLGTNIVHCDLSRVDLNERVHVRVPIHLIGDAVGLKSAGTTLMHAVTELEIECAVTNLPDFIEVDITDLDVGGTIHAGDVALPLPTMKLLSDPKAEVAHIIHHAHGPDSGEAGQVTEQAAPVVLTERKKDEG
jgi:large subunit ribosomal protein L25